MSTILFTLSLLAPGAPAATPQDVGMIAVRASELWLSEGQRVEDGVLLVEGATIRAAGRGVDIPAGTPTIEHDGVVTAGLIAFDSAYGVQGEDSESKRSVLAEGRIVDVFDGSDSGLRDALEQGITTLVIAPAPSTLAGGHAAVVKTAHGTVLAPASHLALSLSDAALDRNRYPTSPSGAMHELARLFGEQDGPFAEAAAGRLPVLFTAPERADLARVLALTERHGLKGAVAGTHLAGELAADVAASGLTVVAGPFATGAGARHLKSVVDLAAADVPLAFALGAPARHPATLRLSAALCMRAGLDPVAAFGALTTGAARTAGVEKRVGRLERDLDADFVLWSGDPLDMRSHPTAVFVDGARVFQGGAQ